LQLALTALQIGQNGVLAAEAALAAAQAVADLAPEAVDAATTALALAEAVLDQSQTIADSLQAQLAAAEATVQAAELELAAAQSTFDQAEGALSDAQDALDAANAALAGYTAALVAAQDSLAVATAAISAAIAKRAEIEALTDPTDNRIIEVQTGQTEFTLTLSNTGGEIVLDGLNSDIRTLNLVAEGDFDTVLRASTVTTLVLSGAGQTLSNGTGTGTVDTTGWALGALTSVDASGLTGAGVTLGADAFAAAEAVNVVGSARADVVTVTGDGAHVIDGGSGADVITVSGNGSVTLRGGNGRDTITLSTNAAEGTISTVSGGAGTDTLTLSNSGAGQIRASGDAGSDLFVITNTGSGTIRVEGGDGDDVFRGWTSLSGKTVMLGGAGNDRLIAGRGQDVMTGGEGADTFVFRANGSSVASISAAAHDRITDFETGLDLLDFSHSSFAGISFLGNAANVKGANALLAGAAQGTMGAVFSAGNNTLYVDRDGNGVISDKDFAVRLNGIVALSVDDFIF
ncbi:MAG: hypothetical protein Q8K20_08635, partial [Gemmobacter sp.]|nr:hypothetical protein [Gemmobacter sp.]